MPLTSALSLARRAGRDGASLGLNALPPWARRGAGRDGASLGRAQSSVPAL